MTKEDFARALLQVQAEGQKSGIGRLGEKSVHAVLKYAYEPHPDCHEVPIGGYVADIAGEDGVIEIQSRDLWKLLPKLTAFLEVCDVTVVHPVPAVEWIVRTDPETGEVSRRRSPRKRTPFDILAELSPLRGILTHPRFHLRLAVLEVERYDVGKAGNRRKTHLDRLPLSFMEEVRLDSPEDYRRLLPDMGDTPFTAADFGKKAGRSAAEARSALLTLTTLGIAQIAGKSGRANLYRLTGTEEEAT